MEAPLMDDTMEMASPYQGHADDFDIDIDVMEDQASNPDRDMTVTDEYLDNSHGPSYDQNGSPDEDMIDDIAEPTMVDADEQYETHQNVEMQYEDEKTYETEMLEDEYEEDIDAPVPEAQPGVHESPKDASDQRTPGEIPPREDGDLYEDHEKTTVESHPETGAETADGNKPEEFEQTGDTDARGAADEPETNTLEPEQIPETADHTNELEQTNQGAVHLDEHAENVEDLNKLETGQDDPSQTQAPADEHKEVDVKLQDEQSEAHQEAAQQAHEPADEPADQALYPVKVYYQENEISLFPPREGDSSETFFLEEEGLAYEPFKKLFESLREVLQDHINTNEVLVMEVESLNIQLTEDSLNTNKVTLHQIVDVYLQLCHNDGIEEPEALYLTLSTRLTIAAEISDLLLAASEGKGLSEIHTWGEYNEGEGASGEFEEEFVPEPNPDEFENPQEAENPQGSLPQDDEVETAVQDQSGRSPQSSGAALEGNDGIAPEFHDNSAEIVEGREVADASGGSEAPDVDEGENPNHKEDFYDVEEQQTESTATLEQLPTESTEEQPEQGDRNEPSYDGKDLRDEYHDEGEYDEGEYDEGEYDDEDDRGEETNLDALGHTEDLEESKDTDTREFTEASHEDHSEYNEQVIQEDLAPAESSPNSKAVAAEALQNDGNTHEEPILDSTSPTSKSRQSPHLEDDSLAITEGLLKGPTQDSKNYDQGVGDASEPQEFNEEAEHDSPLPVTNDQAADFVFDEDTEYLELGIAEEGLGDFDDDADADADAVSPSHVHTKRSREPDDEFDIIETPTPEAKRSRSS
ncbi:hypothetical protein ARAM_005747 [Aspergillus rambellii]|uniref:Uncharacterized protein n=1 Tax=Aspergillus rambellii TaxID=308745 RepID=A0A0F8X205_9EURO|nr:hypothetical protein ARAM_005747 [Aspergillus rambellii]